MDETPMSNSINLFPGSNTDFIGFMRTLRESSYVFWHITVYVVIIIMVQFFGMISTKIDIYKDKTNYF